MLKNCTFKISAGSGLKRQERFTYIRYEQQRGRYCPPSNDFDSGAFLRLFVYIHNDTEEAITCQHPNVVSII